MRRLLFAACFAGATGSSLAAQQPDSTERLGAFVDSVRLSRAQAIAQALARNTQLDIAREQTAQARARRVQAVAIPDPLLTATTDQQSRFFSFDRAGTRPVAVGLAVPFPDKFRLQNRIGVADIRANESNYRLQQQLVAFNASQAYDVLLLSLQRRTDLGEALTLAQDFLRRTQARFDAGSAARVDVIKARVEVAGAKNDLITNEREIANAQTALNRAIGRVAFAPIAPTDALDVPAALPDSLTAEQIALDARPELAMLASERRGAAATTALAREFWLPDITFGVARDYLQPNAAVFSTGVALPLPFLFWQHTKGEIAAASHRERELDATYRNLRAQVLQEVRSVYANASTAMRQAQFLREDLIPAAREAYRVASTSYQLGGSSALEVIDARRALLEAERQLAEALANANTARADLDRALGRSPLGTAPQTR